MAYIEDALYSTSDTVAVSKASPLMEKKKKWMDPTWTTAEWGTWESDAVALWQEEEVDVYFDVDMVCSRKSLQISRILLYFLVVLSKPGYPVLCFFADVRGVFFYFYTYKRSLKGEIVVSNRVIEISTEKKLSHFPYLSELLFLSVIYDMCNR